jgi:hypothetical protein
VAEGKFMAVRARSLGFDADDKNSRGALAIVGVIAAAFVVWQQAAAALQIKCRETAFTFKMFL